MKSPLSLVRSHPEHCLLRRRGGQLSANPYLSLVTAAPSTSYTSSRRSLRNYSVVREEAQEPAPVLTIRVPYRVKFGEVLRVVGSGSPLGDWSAEQGLQLTWKEGDVWIAEIPIQAGHYEFKCVVYNQTTNSVTRWEDGGNRVLDVTPELGTWDVSCQWGTTADMTQTFTPATPPTPASSASDSAVADAKAPGGTAVEEDPLSALQALSEAAGDDDQATAAASQATSAGAPYAAAPAETSGQAYENPAAATDALIPPSSGSNTAVLLLATCVAAGAVAAVAFLSPSGIGRSVLGSRAGQAVNSTLQQSSQAGVRVQPQVAALAGQVSAVQPAM